MDESESRWRVYRATFDTNIFLRALIQRGNLADNLLSLWLDGRIVLVLSQQNTSVKYTRSEIDTLPDETDWERVDALTDEDIEKAALSDPDDPPTDADFWKDATVVMPENIVIVDADLLAWFKAHTPDYEVQINAVLRSHVEANDS